MLISACADRKVVYDKVRKQPRFNIVPMGTVWLRDSLFMDKTEVSNFDWLECLYWSKRRDTALYRKMRTDTLCWWKDRETWNEPYSGYYLRHPAYRDYPAVGISYQQAVLFAQWRSDRVNEFLAIQYGEIKNWNGDSSYTVKQRVRYRLPTNEEWEYAAKAGANGYARLVDERNVPVSNTRECRPLSYGDLTSQVTPPRKKDKQTPGRANAYGLYHLTGNISELIADSAIVKGQNFLVNVDGTRPPVKDPGGKELIPLSDTIYHFPTYRNPGTRPWLGFRCICELLPDPSPKKK